MEIILVGGVNVPGQGGIENYVYYLAKHLQAEGDVVRIISRGSETKEFAIDDVQVYQIKCRESSLSILIHNIKASLLIFRKWRDADIVNYQSIFLPFLYEWIPKIRGISVCHTQHSFAQDNPKHSNFSRWIIKGIYLASSIIFSPIITVSEYNRGLVRKRLRKKSEVINCGVELPSVTSDSDILVKYNIKSGKYYLTIGRIDPVKNLDVLIKAFLKHPKDRDAQLVVCGNINNAYGVQIAVLSQNDNRVIFTGAVHGKDKETLLSHCMAYCLVSSSEGFPIALLEAMSYGNVCICSSIPACKELLPNDAGIWCKTIDEESIYSMMIEFENNPQYYSEYGAKAKDTIERHYTWSKISERYRTYIQTILLARNR